MTRSVVNLQLGCVGVVRRVAVYRSVLAAVAAGELYALPTWRSVSGLEPGRLLWLGANALVAVTVPGHRVAAAQALAGAGLIAPAAWWWPCPIPWRGRTVVADRVLATERGLRLLAGPLAVAGGGRR
ncbi:hypothetical protein GCM10012275_63450 [Longimycelium tulufanense]|uniref:Uncharacterized protein n=1 Tax=Longimycelium tulufanense TaxID=907463 RepID=A0A8J3CIY5_9PSEU|nr:hypothetical protein [Longimycelium tulufanense]GGM84126.1 hypothetical protein GCM10012275_63450 [Longimycelium tulufanense]